MEACVWVVIESVDCDELDTLDWVPALEVATEGEAVLDTDSALVTAKVEVLALPADVTDDVDSEAADVLAALVSVIGAVVGDGDEDSWLAVAEEVVLTSMGVVCELRVVDWVSLPVVVSLERVVVI